MKLRAVLFAVAVLWLPLVLSAQRGPGLWWDGPLNRRLDGLNLTDAQRKQIQATTRDFRNRLVDARAAVEKAEGELSDIFNDGPVDERRGNDAIDRLARTRGELTKVISQMTLKLRMVLTAEQWQELQRQEGGRIGGPGGGPGPGPGGPRRGKNLPGGPNPQGGPGGAGNPPPNVLPPKPGVL